MSYAFQISPFTPKYPLASKKPPVGTLRLSWRRLRSIGPDVEPLVVKPGKTQTQGQSAASLFPRPPQHVAQLALGLCVILAAQPPLTVVGVTLPPH
jgi:hypothetical protein